ncbi:type II toxin-antitoxin system PemK/MazF family toxin [Nocardiopsis sp. CNT312]|uniref:type II toxin-antitoxin system PemK/MazF family toxin n=1 Tax=Nocardiopsis sp. CNT312 TaxID=1137268 RepID=UPI00350F9BB0
MGPSDAWWPLPDASGQTRAGPRAAGPRCWVELQGPFNLSTAVGAPTSTTAAPALFRPEADRVDGTAARVLVDQMRAVDRQIRLGEFAGRLEPHELDDADHACRLILGLL